MMKYLQFLILSGFIILLVSYNNLNSQINPEQLVELNSPSNAGTNFIISFVPAYYNALDDYNQVKFYISSSTSAKVNFKVEASFYNANVDVTPNKVIEHDIHAKFLMPYNKTPNVKTPNENVYENKALFVTSDSPVIIYVVVRLRTYTEGFLALPLNFLGPSYNITTFNDYSNNTNNYAPSTAVIVSAYDNTRVTFKLGGNTSTQVKLANNDSLKTDASVSRTLTKGDVWVLSGLGNNNDLSGSTIRSTKPIAVFTGNYCAQVPTNLSPCEHLIEQEMPISSFSKRYYITPVYGRTTGSWVKVSAYENDTQVKLNNANKGIIQFPYGAEGKGFLSFRVNTDNKPAIISSDKRINVVQFNTGNESLSDKSVPFKAQVISGDNFATKLVFNLPATSSNQYFTDNYLNLVFRLNDAGQIPEELLLTEIIDDKSEIKKVKDIAFNNPIPFPVTEPEGFRYYYLNLKLSRHGRYVVESNRPIAGSVYGFENLNDSYSSAAYLPFKNHEKPEDIYPPSATFSLTGNGNYSGIINDEPITSSKIRSNLAMIHLVKDSSYNYYLFNDEIVPGVDNQVSVELRPINIKEDALAYVRVVDASGNDTIYRFFYSSVPLPPKLTLTQLADTAICPGTKMNFKYSISNGNFLGENIFRVRLGKRNPGQQTFPMTIGEITSSLANNINIQFPRIMQSGDDYFLFVESTVPRIFSDTLNISIYDFPQLNVTGFNKVFANNTYKYYVTDNKLVKKWSVTGGVIIGADDSDTIFVSFNSVGDNKIELNFRNDNCNETASLVVKTKEDVSNEIEGVSQVCQFDEQFYNSLLNVGKFKWSISGGKIIGSNNTQLIQVKWENPGKGNLYLEYSSDDDFIKQIYFETDITELPPQPTISRDNRVLISSASSGNQWYFEGNIIPGARAKNYDTKDVEGNYTVQVTENSCKSFMSDLYNYKISSIDENAHQLGEITVFPTPANETISVGFDNYIKENSSKIAIYDTRGVCLFDTNLVSGNINIDVSKFSSGVYIIRIINGSESHHKAFLILK